MNAKPQRIQLSRRKGFNLQAASLALNGLPAVNCARPGRWGNPWRVGRDVATAADAVREFKAGLAREYNGQPADGLPSKAEIRFKLGGKNLACWCGLDEPCHCDVYLAVANEP